MSSNEQEEQPNIVNVHDPFFLWGLLQHSDELLIESINKIDEDDLSRLYWSCYYHKRSNVCEAILKTSRSIRLAHDAMKKLSTLASKVQNDQPNLNEIETPFRLPTSPNFLVEKLDDASYIPSKGKPLKFVVHNDRGEKKTCIYKHGDDLLQDALCVAVMKEINSIFHEEKIDAEVVLYEVLPVGKLEGLIECVENARPFLDFKSSENENSSDTLKKFVENSIERKSNLFRTFLGFVISGIVLQLADRHDDNIMVTDEGKILHIDFGCAFGQKTKLEQLLGLFMDIPHSPFSEDVFIAIIGENDENDKINDLWKTIKDRLWAAFDALRTHKNRFKQLGEEKYEHFHRRLMAGLKDDEAKKSFDVELEKCYNNRFNSARAFYYKIQQNIVSSSS